MNCSARNMVKVAGLAILGLIVMAIAAHSVDAGHGHFLQQHRFYGPTGFGYPGARYHKGVWIPEPWQMPYGAQQTIPMSRGPMTAVPKNTETPVTTETSVTTEVSNIEITEAADAPQTAETKQCGPKGCSPKSAGPMGEGIMALPGALPGAGSLTGYDYGWEPMPWPVHRRQNVQRAAYPADSVVIKVQLPPWARMYINGRLMHLEGSMRTYMSRSLNPDLLYRYELRAEMEWGGRTFTQTRVINAEAGNVIPLIFTFRRLSAPVEEELPPGDPIVPQDDVVQHTPADELSR